MNDLLLGFVLGVIQGLTEFLPVSSSAHLLFPSLIFGSNDLGLAFDIVVHAGTLCAVIFFFKKEILSMIKSLLKNNTNDVVEYVENKVSKDKKNYRFWKLLEND